MGGAFTAGPVGLLSGLTPKPGVLVTHFFAVALHAMRRALLPLPTPTRLRQGYDLLHVACLIIMPLLQAERTTVLSSGPVQAAVDAIFPWRHSDFIKL
jgi:squalene monooxygenase